MAILKLLEVLYLPIASVHFNKGKTWLQNFVYMNKQS